MKAKRVVKTRTSVSRKHIPVDSHINGNGLTSAFNLSVIIDFSRSLTCNQRTRYARFDFILKTGIRTFNVGIFPSPLKVFFFLLPKLLSVLNRG